MPDLGGSGTSTVPPTLPKSESRADLVLELRIHGVHGTPPHSMLGVTSDKVGQVAGDGITGVFRTRDGEVPLRSLRGVEPRRVAVEAYSWGNLTTNIKGIFGWLTRFLWLFLLPFALANLAYWARPELDSRPAAEGEQATPAALASSDEAESGLPGENKPQRRTARVAARMVRIAAGALTVFFVLAPLTVGVDLVAWQCYRGGAVGCPSLPDWVDFLSASPFDVPQRRIAVGTVPALLAILVLWLLSRQSLSRYEAVTETPTGDVQVAGEVDIAGVGVVLQDPALWSGTYRTQRLRRLHITAALLTVICYTAVPVLHGYETGGNLPLPDSAFGWLELVIGAVAGVGLFIVLFVLVPWVRPGDLESTFRTLSPGWIRSRQRWELALVVSAIALTLLHLGVLLVVPTGSLSDTQATVLGENLWFVGVFLILAGAAAGLSLTGRCRPGFAAAAAILAPLVLLLASYYVWHDAFHKDWAKPVALVGALVCAAGAAVLLLLPRDRRQGYRSAGEVAWGGAGPTVLMVASAWVALLFTTAAVTYSASYLNGEDSVADLGASGDPDEAPADTDVDEPPDADAAFRVNGNVVTITGADILLIPGANASTEAMHVLSGTVAVDSYYLDSDHDAVALPGRGLSGATLDLGKATVRYQNSCLRRLKPDAMPAPIEAEKCLSFDGQRRDGLITPTPASLTIGANPDDSGGTPVTARIAPKDASQAPLLIPQVLIWAPIGQLLVLLGGVLVALITSLRLRRRRQIIYDHVVGTQDVTVRAGKYVTSDDRREWKPAEDRTGSYRGDPRIAEADRKACVDARLRTLLPHRAETTVGWLGVVTVFVSLAVILGAETGRAPWHNVANGRAEQVVQVASSWALLVSLASALGLIALASKFRSSDNARRGVGILWDLTTFWPRAAHPLGPPCYAERVVPEFIARIEWALTPEAAPDTPTTTSHDDQFWGGAKTVVVSAHSQGSTIAVAALSRLRDDQLNQIRLITYGSQLRTWYGRIFPGVYGHQALGNLPTSGRTTISEGTPDVPCPDEPPPPRPVLPGDIKSVQVLRGRPSTAADVGLLDRLEKGRAKNDPPRWVNLFRRTDPIGFRVFSDDDSTAYDRPVLEVPTSPHGDPGPMLMTHGGYQQTPEYIAAVLAWTQETAPPVSTPPGLKPPILPAP